MVNGRNSFAPIDHEELASHATIPGIFERQNIEWLKRRHAVDYLVINWPFLKPDEVLQVQNRMPFHDSIGDKILDIPQATVFRLFVRRK